MFNTHNQHFMKGYYYTHSSNGTIKVANLFNVVVYSENHQAVFFECFADACKFACKMAANYNCTFYVLDLLTGRRVYSHNHNSKFYIG